MIRLGQVVIHFFTPEETAIAGATAAGTFVALLVRRPGWLQMLTWFIVGQLTSYYWAIPLIMWAGWSMLYYRPAGFMFGAVGMLVWTAIFAFSQRLSEDPLGTFATLWRTWKGQGGER